MSFGATYPRAWALTALLTVVPVLWSTEALAGDHHRVYAQTVMPVYPQAPAVAYSYPAPVVTYQLPPAVTYPSPVTILVIGTAPPTGNPPAPPTGNPPAPPTGSPAENFRLDVNTRKALAQAQYNEYVNLVASNPNMTMVERITKLNTSVQQAYTAALAKVLKMKDPELNAAEKKDVDDIVKYILANTGGVQQTPGATGAYPAAYQYNFAPTYAAPAVYTIPAQPATIVQPAVPVQLNLLVQPRHRLFGGW
jgi:hypothetical protein